MGKLLRWCSISFACLFAVAFVLMSCGAASAEPPDLPQWAKDVKAPCKYFDWGADLRIREERFPNALDRNPDRDDPIRDWIRFRTRIWTNFKPMENLSLKLRVTNESRVIQSPDHYMSANPHDRYDHFDEILVDNLYIEWKSILDSPITLRIGRQDMAAIPGTTGPNGEGFGDGLIFMDGTPGDGSRSFYFDAIRSTVDLSQWLDKSSVDLIYIQNQPYSRHHISTIGWDDYRKLEEWDSEAYAIYFKNASLIPKSQWDFYYVYKIEEKQKLEPWDRAPKTVGGDPNYHLHGTYVQTVGTRFAGNITELTKYVVEGAVQFGAWNGEDRLGFATQESIEQGFNVWGKPSIKGFHVYLSGDDPDTDRMEAWDPLYSRWPKWGELMGYMGPIEYGVYYPTNMHILGLSSKIALHSTVTLSGTLQWLFADENTFENNTSLPAGQYFGGGSYRGFDPQVMLAWSPTKYLSTHVLGEWYLAGDDEYFTNPADDDYYFFRWEVLLKF